MPLCNHRFTALRPPLTALFEPGQQDLVTDPVERGEARSTQPTGLVGFEQSLFLLRSVTHTPAPWGLHHLIMEIRHGGRNDDESKRTRANPDERCFGPRLPTPRPRRYRMDQGSCLPRLRSTGACAGSMRGQRMRHLLMSKLWDLTHTVHFMSPNRIVNK